MYSLICKKENAHQDPIYYCAWAKTDRTDSEPERNYIVTGALDCLVKIWLYENNKIQLLHTLEGHDMGIVSVAVSSDGHTLASTSLDSTLIIWDLESGFKVHTIQTEATDIWKVAFSPDGSQIVSGSHTGKLIVYGVEKGKIERELDTRGKFATCVAWSPNGKHIASGGSDGRLFIFDVAQGKLIHAVAAHAAPVRQVAFSPSGHLVLTASDDGTANVFTTSSASQQATLSGHSSWALDAKFSPDGKRVATSGADGSVKLYSVIDGYKLIKSFEEHCDSLLVVLALATVAAALPAQLPAARGNYKFLYAVHDDRSGDFKQQRETRHGNSVQGSYSLLQPDGRTRVVHYTADKEHGFVASVRYEGHVAPPPAKLISAPKVAFAPQAKTAYAIPRVTNVTQKVSYSAPKFAFTAPKVTYTENFGHVSYSSPIMAYHH